MLVATTPAHVDEIAELHQRALTGLLSSLGLRATRAFYRGALASDAGVGFAALSDGAVTGFVFGSPSPERLRRDVVAGNRWQTCLGVCLGVLRRPALLLPVVTSSLPWRHPVDPTVAELTYLAVDAAGRGAGTGTRLVGAFTEALAARGARAYELSVDADNVGAIRFYERLGFRLVGEYRELGVLHRRYRSPPP